MEGHRSEHVAVVGDGERLHPEERRLVDEGVDLARAVEQAELGVEVEVGEIGHSHSMVEGGLEETS